MQKEMKKIWRKNFEIKKVGFQLGVEAMVSFYKYQDEITGKKDIKEGIWVMKEGNNIGTYFIKDELRKIVESTMSKIINHTSDVKNVHKVAIKYNQEYFKQLKKFDKLDFRKISKLDLLKIYKGLYKLLEKSHGYSLPSTWFVDSDGEDLSNFLINYLKQKIKEKKLDFSAPEAFSILTTPDKESFAQIEEKEMLNILPLIKKDKTAKKLFLEMDTQELEQNLFLIDSKLKSKIFKHFKKWRWTRYDYTGPAYNIDYYLDIWSSLIRQKIDSKKESEKLEKNMKKNKERKIEIMKSLELDKKYISIFDLASEIVWLKSYRKDILFYGFYVTDKILKELGRRANLSLMQMKYIAYFEMDKFNQFSENILNQRFKFSVIHNNRDKIKILVGDDAKKFLKEKKFEKIVYKKVSELSGTCAFIGKAKGRVKIINLSEEVGKISSGDIMVSHTTFPSLVPAMKKASAIITDDGGITCHAAIVARELKIPCVVGTKSATMVLKDGDMVEVDAENGIIKIIK
jgi:phosphoenolpyruvate synthase/pyruvate phosphate dikinase